MRLRKVDFRLIHSGVQTSYCFFKLKFYATGNHTFRLFQHLKTESQGQSTEDLWVVVHNYSLSPPIIFRQAPSAVDRIVPLVHTLLTA